jgi:hypothetical protein
MGVTRVTTKVCFGHLCDSAHSVVTIETKCDGVVDADERDRDRASGPAPLHAGRPRCPLRGLRRCRRAPVLSGDGRPREGPGVDRVEPPQLRRDRLRAVGDGAVRRGASDRRLRPDLAGGGRAPRAGDRLARARGGARQGLRHRSRPRLPRLRLPRTRPAAGLLHRPPGQHRLLHRRRPRPPAPPGVRQIRASGLTILYKNEGDRPQSRPAPRAHLYLAPRTATGISVE